MSVISMFFFTFACFPKCLYLLGICLQDVLSFCKVPLGPVKNNAAEGGFSPGRNAAPLEGRIWLCKGYHVVSCTVGPIIIIKKKIINSSIEFRNQYWQFPREKRVEGIDWLALQLHTVWWRGAIFVSPLHLVMIEPSYFTEWLLHTGKCLVCMQLTASARCFRRWEPTISLYNFFAQIHCR